MKLLPPFLAVFAFFPALADGSFPSSPDLRMTPGSLCESPTSKRYAEGIPYCARRVSQERKREVMLTYDEKLGFHVTSMERSLFKIDHLIPLCMGGSNQPDNLWPQHVSVYSVTDPLEQAACEKMAAGRLRQVDAVRYIRRAKACLDETPSILNFVNRL